MRVAPRQSDRTSPLHCSGPGEVDSAPREPGFRVTRREYGHSIEQPKIELNIDSIYGITAIEPDERYSSCPPPVPRHSSKFATTGAWSDSGKLTSVRNAPDSSGSASLWTSAPRKKRRSGRDTTM